jgi:hypothetical protein
MTAVFVLHEILAMSFDSQAIFANLAEKEKTKGHHSPEGRAIRTLSRALNGWSMGALSAPDVWVLCDQGVEDWLKARLNIPAWSQRSLPELLAPAMSKELITRSDAVRLQRIHSARSHPYDEQALTARKVNGALEFCIQLVEKHW